MVALCLMAGPREACHHHDVKIPLAMVVALLAVASLGCRNDDQVLVGVTSSVQDTGLLDELVLAFRDEYGYAAKPIVGGSGQILELARNGELDAIMTHAPADEMAFVSDAYGRERIPVMRNYFQVAGPRDDPAGVSEAVDLADAFGRIATAEAAFLSRGDGSGTHRREMAVWQAAGIDPTSDWYRESAAGQGQTLSLANDSGAYTLVDSATFTVFQDILDIVLLHRDPDIPNVYSVIPLDGDRIEEVNVQAGDDWVKFMTGSAQQLIAEYGVEEYGQPLFEPLVLLD